jgi:hypothetical protein
MTPGMIATLKNEGYALFALTARPEGWVRAFDPAIADLEYATFEKQAVFLHDDEAREILKNQLSQITQRQITTCVGF